MMLKSTLMLLLFVIPRSHAQHHSKSPPHQRVLQPAQQQATAADLEMLALSGMINKLTALVKQMEQQVHALQTDYANKQQQKKTRVCFAV